jgi:hypothetical protein
MTARLPTTESVAGVSGEPAARPVPQRPVLHGFGRPAGGLFLLKTEILGLPVMWDVHYDYAPPEPSVNYAGYLDIIKVLWNDQDITDALTKEMCAAIREEMECARERNGREENFA